MWTPWSGWLRARRLSEAGGIAVAEALGLEAPARLPEARFEKWPRIGEKLARIIGACAVLVIAANVLVPAKSAGVLGEGGAQALHILVALVALRIVSPAKVDAHLRAAYEGLKAVLLALPKVLMAFHWSSPLFLLFGLGAFYGVVFALMAHNALLGFQDATWLSPEEHAARLAWMTTLRHVLLYCFVAVIFYRMPHVHLFELPGFIAKACVWVVVNFAATLFVFDEWYGKGHRLAPPNVFNATNDMMQGFVLLGALMFIVSLNQIFLAEGVIWFDERLSAEFARIDDASGDAAPNKPQPNLLT